MFQLEDFSAGYWLAPTIRVTTYSGKRAIIQDDLYDELVEETGHVEIVGATGSRHFELHPEYHIPANLVALPEHSRHSDDGSPLLISKYTSEVFFDV